MNLIPYISSIARELILPPFSLFLLLAFGLLISRWRPSIGRRLSALAVALLFLLCIPAVARLFIEPLEHFAPALHTPRDVGAQAIVVLAAGRLSNAPEYENRDIPDYIALPRLRYAAKLHKETGLPVLVSGGGATRRESLADGMARALENEFKTPVRWTEGRSLNTAENAQFSARILRGEKLRRILLVTDAMHMRRSVMAFTHAGIEAIPAPTLFFSAGNLGPLHFLPSAEGLRHSHYAIYEWIGIFWYWLLHQRVAMMPEPIFD